MAGTIENRDLLSNTVEKLWSDKCKEFIFSESPLVIESNKKGGFFSRNYHWYKYRLAENLRKLANIIEYGRWEAE